MKRDMDLIRQILLAIEEHPHGMAPDVIRIDGYAEEQIGYHVHLLGDAGLLRVMDVTDMGSKSPQAMPVGMTWAGHEFLDAARSETIWERAKQRLGGQWAAVPLEVLKALLMDLIRRSVDMPGG